MNSTAKALFFAALGLIASGMALAQTPDLKQIMADPQWIGPPVQRAWWQLDGSAAYYTVQRRDSELYDTHRIDPASGEDRVLNHADLAQVDRSEEHTSELQSRGHLVCRLLLEKKKKKDEVSTRLGTEI